MIKTWQIFNSVDIVEFKRTQRKNETMDSTSNDPEEAAILVKITAATTTTTTTATVRELISTIWSMNKYTFKVF